MRRVKVSCRNEPPVNVDVDHGRARVCANGEGGRDGGRAGAVDGGRRAHADAGCAGHDEARAEDVRADDAEAARVALCPESGRRPRQGTRHGGRHRRPNDDDGADLVDACGMARWNHREHVARGLARGRPPNLTDDDAFARAALEGASLWWLHGVSPRSRAAPRRGSC